MRVLIPGALRIYTGQREIQASGTTLAAVLSEMDRRYPGIRFRIIDEQDRMRPHVRFFVNGDQDLIPLPGRVPVLLDIYDDRIWTKFAFDPFDALFDTLKEESFNLHEPLSLPPTLF